jgi:CRP/FNR family transcriptional regulator, cyclic AMP receptor protein
MSERIDLDKRDTGPRHHINGNAVPNSSPSISPPQTDPHKFLMQIGAGRSTSTYAKHTDVFVQGTDADSVFYLQDGRVKVSMTEQGEETTLAILEAGQFFGDGCLGGQTHRIVSTKALTDCRITKIDKTTMIEALDKQPWFSKVFIDNLFSRNRQIEGEVMDQLFSSKEQRLARVLLEEMTIRRIQLEAILSDKLTMVDGNPDDQYSTA